MKNESFGNIPISEIIRMEIESLGTDIFYDTSYLYNDSDPEWTNFKQKIKTEQKINFEDTVIAKKRISLITRKILDEIIEFKKSEDFKNFYNSLSDEKKEEFNSYIFIPEVLIKTAQNFFSHLNQNISDFLPGSVPQKIFTNYFFTKSVKEIIYPANRRNFEISKYLFDGIKFYFEKNCFNFYEFSLNKTNEKLRKAFKDKNILVEDLKKIVDTKRGNSLSHPSTSWNVLKKLMEKDKSNPLMQLEYEDRFYYITSYFIYILYQNFTKSISNYISQKQISTIIETLINNESFIKSKYIKSQTKVFRSEKIRNSADFIFFGNTSEFSVELMESHYYQRNSPEEMQILQQHIFHIQNLNELINYSGQLTDSYRKDSINKEMHLFYLDKICTKENVGMGNEFFYNWYLARIEYALYLRENNKTEAKIKIVSDAYSKAFDSGIYFAGHYLKNFIKEAIDVFLIEYRMNKKTGKIKQLFQRSTALGLTMENYPKFKNEDFKDLSIALMNPFESLINLFNSGIPFEQIAEMIGISRRDLQPLFRENSKFLNREDNDIWRYITDWEDDEDYL